MVVMLPAAAAAGGGDAIAVGGGGGGGGGGGEEEEEEEEEDERANWKGERARGETKKEHRERSRHTHAMNAREFHVGCHRSGGGIPVLGASRRRGFMYKFPLAPPSRVRAKVAVYPEYNESERDNPSETSPHEGAFPSLGNFFGGRGQMRTNNYCSETRKRMSLEVGNVQNVRRTY
ncbi:hypothetical protein HZH68_003278 [Vespula germanica]|uniref:Uncharacterized protein n=1 Tax=Vespula germanica TaxID=30212 RepID=A0A834NNZ1_VESGE|nr:hypothetical protein HZH68_003278 [Vespula germanica]